MKHIFAKFIGIPFLIIALMVPFASVGAERPLGYSFVTIDPPGAINGVAVDIGPEGEVVGGYQTADGRTHGFMLKDGEFITLDYPLAGVTWTQARGIAPSGDITGIYFVGSIAHGFLLTDEGEWSTVDYPGQPNTVLWGILPDGTLVGANYAGFETASMRAVVISPDGSFVELDRPCSSYTGATPDGKTLVGYYRQGPNYPRPNIAFVIDKGAFIPIPFPGSYDSLAFDTTPDGRMIVGSYNTNGSDTHGYVVQRRGASVADWEFTSVEVPGAAITRIYGCNPAGDLVGNYMDGTGWHLYMASRSGGK